MKSSFLKRLICMGLISGSLLIGNVTEAGVVTDRVPLQCYADHQVNTYNSPGAAQRSGYISANVDKIQILEVRPDGWCRGTYPVKNGSKTRWFKITDVFADAGYTNRTANVKGKQAVYRTRGGSATIGSVSNNEGVIVVADNGSRAQIIYRLDNGTGYKMGWVPSSTVSAPVPQGHNPQGNFDGLYSRNPNQITVEGWAADRDNMNESLRIHVYVGGPAGSGAESCEIIANKSRPDVRNYFANQGIPAGEFYGFNETINVSQRTGNQPVYVYAINVGSGSNVELGHKDVYIIKRGDVNNDGKIDSTDVNLVRAMMLGDAKYNAAGDVNGDGKITAQDLSTIKGMATESTPIPPVVPVPPDIPVELQNLINRWNNKTWRDHTYLPGVKQCKEFASYIFDQMYHVGYIGGGSTSSNAKNYLISLANPSRVGLRGYRTNLSNSSAQELFSGARSGDFVQIRRRNGGPHSGIFVNRTSSGIVLFEANADGRNSIRTNTYTYDELASRNYAMSLYYAK